MKNPILISGLWTMLKARGRAIWTILVTAFYANSFGNRQKRLKSIGIKKAELILFVISPADLNSPSDSGTYPDKVYSLHELAISLGYRSQIVFHPWIATKKVKNSIPIIRIERIAKNVLTFFKLRLNPEEFRKEGNLRDWWTSIGVLEKIQYCVWRDFLNLTKPKIVFGIDIRESEVFACNTKSIPIYEIMHGTFSKEELPLRRFSRGETKTVEVDMFLTWDSHYSRISEALNIPTKVIGHPNKNYLDIKSIKPNQPVKKALITLGWGYKKSMDPYGILDSDLAEFIPKVVSCGFILIFRLHPVTIARHIRDIRSIRAWFDLNFPGSYISLPENSSLLEDLQSVDIHITHESGAFYEAGLLGVPTIFTGRRGFEAIPKEYINSGGVHFWENKENLGLPDLMISSGKKFGNTLDVNVVTELITR
jgi:hypothetical protein